jgi:site-specific DNA recombinase
VVNCAVYVRVSSQLQKDNYSVSSQRQLGVDFCKGNGWTYELYDEVGSAKDIHSREEFSRLVADIEDGNVNAIWCVEFTRLTRGSEEDTSFLKKLCIEHSVQVWILNEQMKFESPEDELFFSIRASVSRYERRKMKERQKRALAQKRNEGKWKNARQFGYDKDINIIPDQAETVRFIFNQYINGWGYPRISKELNHRGIKTFYGSTWGYSSIHKIVHNPVYAGKSWDHDGNEIDSKVYPPIISEDVWNLTKVRIREVQLAQARQKPRVSKFVLSGLMTCKHCGSKYYYHAHNQGYSYYRHSRYTEKDQDCKIRSAAPRTYEAEYFVQASYLSTFEDYESISEFYNSLHKAETSDDELTKLQGQLSDLQAQKSRLIDAVAAGVMSLEDIKTRNDKLSDQISKIEGKIEAFESKKKNETTDYLGLIDLFANTSAFQIWDMDDTQKKELYARLIKALTYDGEVLEVEWINGAKHSCNPKKPPRKWKSRVDMVEAYYREKYGL